MTTLPRVLPQPGAPIHVRKFRPGGALAYAWDGVVLRCDQEGIVLRAAFNVPLVEMGFTTFRQGDVFVEFYYWERWYNVFQVSAPDGTLKGWYCNVGAPARLDPITGHLSYVDLALDVWMNPDGSHVVLDEEELAAYLAGGVCSPEEEEGARRGREELQALVTAGQLPRWNGPAG